VENDADIMDSRQSRLLLDSYYQRRVLDIPSEHNVPSLA